MDSESYQLCSGGDTRRDETADFTNFDAPSQLFLGIAAGGEDVEYHGRDFSVQALAADAELGMVPESSGNGPFSPNETQTPGPCSFNLSHDRIFDSAFNASGIPLLSQEYNPLGTWSLDQNHGSDEASCSSPVAWSHVRYDYDAGGDGPQSLASKHAAPSCASQDFGLVNQGPPGSNNWDDSHTSPVPTQLASFSQDTLSPFGSYRTSASQPIASTNERFPADFHSPYSVSLSRQPVRERAPTLLLSTPKQLNGSNMIGMSSNRAASLFSIVPSPGQTGFHSPSLTVPTHFQPYDERGRPVNRCPVRNYVNSWDTCVVAADLQSCSASTTRARSGYAPSETESSHTTYTSHADSHHQHLAVPTQKRSRRRSDPSPVPEIPRASSALDRSLSSRSSRVHHTLRPRPQYDRAETRPSIGGYIVMPRPKDRGRRNKPLSPDKREEANKTRNDRTVCIGCKISKVGCKIPRGSSTCLKCSQSMKSPNNDKRPWECTPAYFIERVEQASTNSIAQYVINHICTDGYRRRRIDLPRDIDIADLLSHIDTLRQDYVIRVSRDDAHLYDLDLDACFKYIQHNCPPGSNIFEKFINSLKIHKNDKWESCVQGGLDLLEGQNLYEALLSWGEMPSWVTYSLVPISNAYGGRQLDPEHEDDIPMLYTAAQVARIVVRKLELEAYDQLQKSLLANGRVTREILWDLGRIALSLRRRVAWWKCLGTGAPRASDLMMLGQDDEYEGNYDPIDRVTSLCQILYMYWCFMRRCLSRSGEDLTEMEVIRVRYPDSVRHVNEKFPGNESQQGFKSWMDKGIQHFKEAGVEDRRMAL